MESPGAPEFGPEGLRRSSSTLWLVHIFKNRTWEGKVLRKWEGHAKRCSSVNTGMLYNYASKLTRVTYISCPTVEHWKRKEKERSLPQDGGGQVSASVLTNMHWGITPCARCAQGIEKSQQRLPVRKEHRVTSLSQVHGWPLCHLSCPLGCATVHELTPLTYIRAQAWLC